MFKVGIKENEKEKKLIAMMTASQNFAKIIKLIFLSTN